MDYLRAVKQTTVIIGGGAAGVFCAANLARLDPNRRVLILEKSSRCLSKVKVSGGGRCNVTHACFEPKQLVQFYPRGNKELLGPFHAFQPGDMFDWLEQRGVALKIEEDGRVFPTSDRSQTIIDVFEQELNRFGVEVWLQSGLQSIQRLGNGWCVHCSDGRTIEATDVVWATGSSELMWNRLAELGHSIVQPVPSLFTFNVDDKELHALAGVSAQHTEVRIEGTRYTSEGPLLLTHWGMSGPGILKLSAWAARELHGLKYDFNIRVCWDSRYAKETWLENVKEWRLEHARAKVRAYTPAQIPQRLWSYLIDCIPMGDVLWGDVSNRMLERMVESITASSFHVQGKSTFKDEFVTAGGVLLSEVDFRTMRSKVLPHMYFCGEVLDMDAVTGGFNFQAAWTTAMIAATAIATSANHS
ncbi:MAG: aminoacetone oxidase family FAD-binding enzyme [Flavobacteriales bacterium]